MPLQCPPLSPRPSRLSARRPGVRHTLNRNVLKTHVVARCRRCVRVAHWRHAWHHPGLWISHWRHAWHHPGLWVHRWRLRVPVHRWLCLWRNTEVAWPHTRNSVGSPRDRNSSDRLGLQCKHHLRGTSVANSREKGDALTTLTCASTMYVCDGDVRTQVRA